MGHLIRLWLEFLPLYKSKSDIDGIGYIDKDPVILIDSGF